MLSPVLSSGDTAVNKTDKIPWPYGRKTDNYKHIRKYIICQMVISAIKKEEVLSKFIY